MTANIPRPEHPFPQMVRENWMNLNGTWDFEFDFGVSGLERGYERRTDFKDKIIVPFCPESVLSGIGYSCRLVSPHLFSNRRTASRQSAHPLRGGGL